MNVRVIRIPINVKNGVMVTPFALSANNHSDGIVPIRERDIVNMTTKSGASTVENQVSESSIDRKIIELQAQIDKLNVEKKRLQELSPEKRLAEALHSLQCNWNHTDGCGWFYETDWKDVWAQNSSHARYLEKARKVMNALPDMNVEDIIRIAQILK